MSEKKYTPGPWASYQMVNEDGSEMSKEDMASYTHETIMMSEGDKFYFVAGVTESGEKDICHTGNGPTSQQNARLIACAPELLEALESLMAVRVIEADVTYGMAWNKAQQVVAKAKGETE